MRAGKLDRTITVQSYTETLDEFGNPVGQDWSDVVTLRAQLIEASTEEFQRAYGASGETAIIFRTRYFDDVTLADRIFYDGAGHNIIEIKELGRRRGLEIRTRRIGSDG